MSLKIIAIGNTLMEDDGVGIRAVEKIQGQLPRNIEVIIGETDFEYSVSSINQGDYIIIIDAALSGKNPGEITCIPIKNYRVVSSQYSQHGLSLLNLLYLHNINVMGYIIAIEISEVKFGLGLSIKIEKKFDEICYNLIKAIHEILEDKDSNITEQSINKIIT